MDDDDLKEDGFKMGGGDDDGEPLEMPPEDLDLDLDDEDPENRYH